MAGPLVAVVSVVRQVPRVVWAVQGLTVPVAPEVSAEQPVPVVLAVPGLLLCSPREQAVLVAAVALVAVLAPAVPAVRESERLRPGSTAMAVPVVRPVPAVSVVRAE